MRVPLRHIAGHLAWSVHGHAWAVYRIHPGPDARGQVQESVPGTYIPAPVRTELLEQVTTLVRSLSGAAPRLFGLCAQVDAAEVVWRMTEGLHDGDGGLRPGAQGWVEHLEAALDLLEGQEMHQRTWWLAVPLERENQKLKAASALWADVADAFGLRAGPVTVAEVNTCREQAARVEAHLSGGVPMRPAAPAEIVWMIQHALHRGLAEPLLGEAARSQAYGGQVTSGVLHSPSYADLGQVRLEEGGTERSAGTAPGSSSSSRGPARRGRVKRWHKKQGGGSPLRRRWLQIETDHGTGYQAHLALAECPRAVAAEAADLFAQLEVLDFPVDFTIDLMLVGAEKARQQVQRKKNELVDQADQYDAQPTGMPASIPDAAGDLGELDRRLSHTSVEVEVQSVTALHVWGPNAALCDARARALEKLLAGADYRAVRPAGLQAELFMLGLPGTVRPQRLREFTQYQLSEDWAMSGAFTHREVGDPNGIFSACQARRSFTPKPETAPTVESTSRVQRCSV
ncbi:ATP/GTP-binding protein, partial [Streptomyces spectabilis]